MNVTLLEIVEMKGDAFIAQFNSELKGNGGEIPPRFITWAREAYLLFQKEWISYPDRFELEVFPDPDAVFDSSSAREWIRRASWRLAMRFPDNERQMESDWLPKAASFWTDARHLFQRDLEN